MAATQRSIGTRPSAPSDSPASSGRPSVIWLEFSLRTSLQCDLQQGKKETDFHVSVKELEDEGTWIMKRQFRGSIRCNQGY